MKIVVTANGAGLDAPATPIFGRCSKYVFVDTETMAVESVDNPAMSATGGAGIQAAQFIVERGAQAVISGNVGPNAFNVLQAADVPIYLFDGGTVRQAVEAYKAGQLSVAGAASAKAHDGMGTGQGVGRSVAVPPAPTHSQEEEIESLRDMAGGLRKQLAEVMERLDRLEKGA